MNGLNEAGQDVFDHWLCQTIGYQITDADIHDKLDNRFDAFIFILERKVLVQKVAQNASENVVARRGNPVAHVEDVIK